MGGDGDVSRLEDLDRFYELLRQLEQQTGGPRRLADADCKDGLPRRGVYLFFEPGEVREDGRTPRVVRVGTHAVSVRSRATLWDRLSYHRGHIRGRHAGGGNHRASIFRFHVGTALLNLGLGEKAAADHWGTDRRPKDEHQRELEHRHELSVSQVIRYMPFLWLAVDDPPGKESDRKVIEANAIGLLSNLGRPPIDPPSPDWLGHSASHTAVCGSGLWNVDHVDEAYNPNFLTLLEQYIFQQKPL